MMKKKPQKCSPSYCNNVIVTTVIVLLFAQVYLTTTAGTVLNYGEVSETVNGTDGRLRGARNRQGKDFVLGGLFPIHTDKDGRQCGEVRQERGLERMEAMLFAIDKINSDPNLLQQLSLGYDIRDTCNSENIGLDESIDLIITGSTLDIESCQSAATAVGMNSSNNVQYVQPSPTLGIVGAAGSRVSVPVASLTRLFQTPQVSYASSSSILSNRDRYSFFYRTIPPDNLQARAMIDILLHFEWTFVSTIFSINPYGQPGIDAFHKLARETGICIDLDAGIDSEYDDEEYDTLVARLIKSKANVVVIFAAQGIAESILTRIYKTEAKERFVFIASDAWARSINVVHKANATAAGLFGIVPFTEHVEEFHEYFSNLTIDSNVRNPWFREFYSAFANCSLDNVNSNSTRPSCATSMNVTRLPRYQQGNFIPLVFDAVYTFALALDNFLKENCDQENFMWYRNNRTCAGQTRELNGTSLLEYIARLSEANPVTGNNLLFDELGNVESLYEILNYQAKPVGNDFEYVFQRVGTWDSSVVNDSNLEALNLSIAQPQFGVDTSLHKIINEPIVSQCTQCSPGQHRRVGQSDCCGVCDPCSANTYSNTTTATECLLCPNDTWGNNPADGSTECVPIPRSFLDFSHPYSVIIIIVATVGLLIVLSTVIIFSLYWKTPIVKSSGREQMMLLLIGIASSFLLAFFFVAPPHPALCAIQRIGLWFSFSLMFGSLMVKIVRVARIFLRNKDLARPRFIEPIYQVLFTFFIVIVQLVIVLISLLVVNPNINSSLRFNADMPNELPQIVITCIPENVIILVLSVGYETVIIMVATILGGLSFKYPANFNEAKYIAFCLFALLVIWIAFIITYFATQSTQEFQNIAVSLAVVMSGYAVLICIFGPKLFIVLLQPHKNTSKNFEPSSTGLVLTTTTGIAKGNVESMDKSNQKLDNNVDPSDAKNGLSMNKYGGSQKANKESSLGETSKV